ncbi:MAG: lipoyl(octanoyl) transferase LipB [bacterium]
MSIYSDRLFGWVLDIGKVDYQKCLGWQRGLVKMRREGFARDTLILVEHPPVVTVGKDGHEENFKNLKVQPVFVERGGDVTYHGPGQLVVYFIFNLQRRGLNLHKFIENILDGIIITLAKYNVKAHKDEVNTGIWVDDKKIASLGIAIKRWVTFHGVAINLNTDLNDFEQINPCGLESGIMTSLKKISGEKIDMKQFSENLVMEYDRIFETTFKPIELESLSEDIESQAGGYTI